MPWLTTTSLASALVAAAATSSAAAPPGPSNASPAAIDTAIHTARKLR